MRMLALEVRRDHPLRRPLRAVDRRARRAQGAGGQARLVLLRERASRRTSGAAEWDVSPGRPHPVGLPRLGARRCACRRSSAPIPEPFTTDSRASGARCGSSARTSSRQPARDGTDALERVGVPDVGLVARRARHRGGDAAGGGALAAGAHRARRVRRWRTGPETSGVFARFTDDGTTLELLDERRPRRAPRPRAATASGSCCALQPRADELRLGRDRARPAGPRGRRAGARRGASCATRSPWRRPATGGEAPAGGPMSLIPVYRSRPSALHTARAGAGAALCGAFALAGALYLHPLILSAALGGDRARRACSPGWAARSAARCGFALPFALLIAVVNPLVYPEGDTLLFRGGEMLGRALRHHARGHRRGPVQRAPRDRDRRRRSGCCRPPSIPTSCCGCCGASRTARR